MCNRSANAYLDKLKPKSKLMNRKDTTELQLQTELAQTHPALIRLDETVNSYSEDLAKFSDLLQNADRLYREVNPEYFWKERATAASDDTEALKILASDYDERVLTFVMHYLKFQAVELRLKNGRAIVAKSIASVILATATESDMNLRSIMQAQVLSAHELHKRLLAVDYGRGFSSSIKGLAFQIQREAFEDLVRNFESAATGLGYPKEMVAPRENGIYGKTRESRAIYPIPISSSDSTEFPSNVNLWNSFLAVENLFNQSNSCLAIINNEKQMVEQSDFCLNLIKTLRRTQRNQEVPGVSVSGLLNADTSRFVRYEQKRLLLEFASNKLKDGLETLSNDLREAISETTQLLAARYITFEERLLRVMINNCLAVDCWLRHYYRHLEVLRRAYLYNPEPKTGIAAVKETYHAIATREYASEVYFLKEQVEKENASKQSRNDDN